MTNELSPDDPRSGLASIAAALIPLMEAAAEHIEKPTPCDDFTVKELLEHVVAGMQRLAAVGNGDHWATVTETPRDQGWVEAFTAAARATHAAWEDPAKLEAMFEFPWGTLPGAPALLTYTAELATHGWDIATAIGADFTVDDIDLAGALVAAKMLPSEGRDAPDMPFGEIVDPGADASALLQIAGWFGRDVAA